MKTALGALTSMTLAGMVVTSLSTGAAQNAADTPEAHVALARTAAGDSYLNLFNFLCAAPASRGGGPRAGTPQGAVPQAAATQAAAPRGGALQGGALQGGAVQGGAVQGGAPRGGGRGAAAPERSTWYAAPVKVFDNLYFVGQSEYSAWAVTTSEGIILIDTLFDYSVEDEVVAGLKTLGLDPAAIRYAVVTHPHPDHHGGARLLQDRYRTRIVMSAADWDVIDRLTGTRPSRDLVATDGQTLTLGDTTVTLYVTPGHTPGTLSVVIPVRGGGARHTAALWGGTGLNADRDSLEQYVRSAQRFGAVAQQVKADIVLSNHTDWDQSKVNLPQLAARAPGTQNPYVVGPVAVSRYLKVAEECATARLLRLN